MHFLNYDFPDLLNLLSFDEAVQLAEYVELHHSLPSSRPTELVLLSFARQPTPCYTYTNHTSLITASTTALDSNKAPAQALQPCELLKSTALQQGMQEHAEPGETVGEISLPLSLEQMGGKQEQQHAPQSHADKASSGVLCTDELLVEVQPCLNHKQEEVPKRLPNKVAAPLLSRPAGRASGFNFKRALQWANGPLEHKGQPMALLLVLSLIHKTSMMTAQPTVAGFTRFFSSNIFSMPRKIWSNKIWSGSTVLLASGCLLPMALLLVLSLIHKTGFELFGIDVEHVQPKRCSLRCTIWFDFMAFML